VERDFGYGLYAVASSGGVLTGCFDYGVGVLAELLYEGHLRSATFKVIAAAFAQWHVHATIPEGHDEQTAPLQRPCRAKEAIPTKIADRLRSV
jgi:hypothetical protein